MKHGDKTKGKASKASGKKVQPSGKTSKAGVSAKTKSSGEKDDPKASSKAGKQEGARRPGAQGSGEGGFSNPAVGAAFKLALKKYPNAFRKLTD